MDRERIVIAELIRPRGNRGELAAISQTDIPGRLEGLAALEDGVQIRLSDGSDVRMQVEEAWQHGNEWVLKFAGVDSIDAADKLRSGDVWVTPQARAPLADGGYYQSDLVGCCLVDLATGAELGIIEGWQQFGGPALMAVRHQGREVLIPFVPDICRTVDLPARQVLVSLPDGLLDL